MSRRHGPEDYSYDDTPLFSVIGARRVRIQPPTNGTATSAAAAASVRESAETMRGRVLEYIRLCGENGATREEIELGLDMPGSTVRPRVVELMKLRRVCERPDVTRATSSGRQAAILVSC